MCEEATGAGGGGQDAEPKTRTPHKDVGKKVSWSLFNKVRGLLENPPFSSMMNTQL